jgi:hypothetical protein
MMPKCILPASTPRQYFFDNGDGTPDSARSLD